MLFNHIPINVVEESLILLTSMEIPPAAGSTICLLVGLFKRPVNSVRSVRTTLQSLPTTCLVTLS